MLRRCNPKGLTRVEVLVVVLAGVFALALLPVVSYRGNPHPARLACAANLATLGKAMFLYANDCAGAFPRAGGRTTTWGEMVRWDASSREAAFELAADGSGGEATISSCFYLLIRYGGVLPKHVVCPGDKGTTEFRLSDVSNVREGLRLTEAWDFGPEAWKHYSYAYHIPFGLYALTTAHDPCMPLAADRNPWMKSPAGEAKQLPAFRPDLPLFKGTREQARKGNSMSHGEDGQNVLFVDGHVAFEERSYCGLDNDNIYLYSDDPTKGSPVGRFPVRPTAVPGSRRDSVLVHDAPTETVAPPVAPNIDSKDLKQTVVVATLECPLPEHKNAIWCATFQMAWDKFKQDIIGEPIRIPAVQRIGGSTEPIPIPHREHRGEILLCGRRLRGQWYHRADSERDEAAFPVGACAHLRQQVQDPARCHARVHLPECRYRVRVSLLRLSHAILISGTRLAPAGRHGLLRAHQRAPAAAMTSCASKWKSSTTISAHPLTPSSSLSICPSGHSPIRSCWPACRAATPSVRLPRCCRRELPNSGSVRITKSNASFGPSDTLIVPDVLYKLTHHFDELLGKHFGNPRWTDTFFFEALQKIDFTLSRTGVVLKSDARLAATAAAAPTEEPPRHLHFDRPFLICVQKREPNATPFFLMWVDNAELMKPYGSGEKGS